MPAPSSTTPLTPPATAPFDAYRDGLSAASLFDSRESSQVGLTYGDFVILPDHIDFGVESVELASPLTRGITLKTLLPAPPWIR